jgi:beta-lactamase superfamily II metal-dependent hydrolase
MLEMTPPEADELEVSLFGPGFGECVLVHLGSDEWMIIDSCLHKGEKHPAPLDYLKKIGVQPSSAVKLIIATHWHDDHVKGLGEVVRECVSARFWCSQALFAREFIALTDLWKKQASQDSPLNEFSLVMEALGRSGRMQKDPLGKVGFGFASANKCIWKRPINSHISETVRREIHSLSPREAAVKSAFETVAAMFPTRGVLRQPIPSRPNQSSVVLWVTIGNISILLGADMEEENNPYGGWKVIVNSTERPDGRATLIKVPHHGSSTGEYAPMWAKMLTPSPLAMLTPFTRLKIPLPTHDDIERIIRRTDKAFISATVRNRGQQRRNPEVRRTMREVLKWSRPIDEGFGQICARKKIPSSVDSGWQVQLFGDACRLDALLRN